MGLFVGQLLNAVSERCVCTVIATIGRKRLKMTKSLRRTRLELKNDNEDTQLDSELWQGLPQEVLELVIAKLPFVRVVAFRIVCKKWCFDVIFCAARQMEASSRCSLLYFYFGGDESQSQNRWLQLCSAQSESAEEFQSKSFPTQGSHDEDVRLLICERGLLFYAIICRQTGLAQDIVVSNPLLCTSKKLALPAPFRASCDFGWRRWNGRSFVGPAFEHSFVGATFDNETGNYSFVIAVLKVSGQLESFLYDSLSSAWARSSSIFPALGKAVDGSEDVFGNSHQSVCCNGNLVWQVSCIVESRCSQYVLTFDIQHGTWSVSPVLSDVVALSEPEGCIAGTSGMRSRN